MLADELASAALADHPRERQITLLAVSVSNLVDEPALQLELPLGLGDDPTGPGRRRARLDGSWTGRWTRSGPGSGEVQSATPP